VADESATRQSLCDENAIFSQGHGAIVLCRPGGRKLKPISPRQPEAAMPRIAVIVPNHNDSRYLPRCIRSILEQEAPPDELILIDDRSTDDSVAVIRSLIAGRREARLIENPVNLGPYGAVDVGM
jgi:cellulose synthase/poly-beta-1,6-N-acetylglucosamine synthase-like glycosyltransferase